MSAAVGPAERLHSQLLLLHQSLVANTVHLTKGPLKKPTSLTEFMDNLRTYEQSLQPQAKTPALRCARGAWLAHTNKKPESVAIAAEALACLELNIFSDVREEKWTALRPKWLADVKELAGGPATSSPASRVALTPPALPKLDHLKAAVTQFLTSIDDAKGASKPLPKSKEVDSAKDIAGLTTLFLDASPTIFQTSYKQGFAAVRDIWTSLARNTNGPISAVPLASSLLTLDQWLLASMRTPGWTDSPPRATWAQSLQAMGGEVWSMAAPTPTVPQMWSHLQTLHKAFLPGVVSNEGQAIMAGAAPDGFVGLVKAVLAYQPTIQRGYLDPTFRLQMHSWSTTLADAPVGASWTSLLSTALLVLEWHVLPGAWSEKWKAGGESATWRAALWKCGGYPPALVLQTPELLERLQKQDRTLTSITCDHTKPISSPDLEAQFHTMLLQSGSVLLGNLKQLSLDTAACVTEAGLLRLMPALRTGAPKLELFALNSRITKAGTLAVLDLLAAAPSHLTTFFLNGTATGGAQDAEVWSAAMKAIERNTTVTKLQLAGWKIDARATRQLVAALRTRGTPAATVAPPLHSLLLQANLLDVESAQELAAYLNENKSLQRLVLNTNPTLGDAGLLALAGALKTNRTLTSLELKACSVSLAAADALRQVVMPNKVMAKVDLDKNVALAKAHTDPQSPLFTFLQAFSLQVLPPGMIKCDVPLGSYFSGKLDAKGKRHGHGTVYFRNGDPYRGMNFVHGLLEGPGFSVNSGTGTRCDGVYVNSRLSTEHLTIVTTVNPSTGITTVSEGFLTAANKMIGCITQTSSDSKNRKEVEILEHAPEARYGAEWTPEGQLLSCGLWVVQSTVDAGGVTSRKSVLCRSRPVPTACFRIGRFVPAGAKAAKASALLPDGGWYVGPLTSDEHRLPMKEGGGVFYRPDGTIREDGAALVDQWTKDAVEDAVIVAQATAAAAESASAAAAPPTPSALSIASPSPSSSPPPNGGDAAAVSSPSAAASASSPSSEVESGPFEEQFASQLSGIVGQDALKRQLRDFYDLQLWERRRRKGGQLKTDMHMIFGGPPGTGKTTMAGLIAAVLKQMNIVSGSVHCVHANSCIGKVFGETERLVDKAVAEAQGGILFIDEAYCWSKYHGKHYGPSAISQVMDHMDKRSCVFIFAGYTPEMEEFTQVNAGLSRRVPFSYTFEPYTRQELFEILTIKAEQEELVLRASPEEIGGLLNTVRTEWLATQNGGFVGNWLSAATSIKAAEAIKQRLVGVEMSTLDASHFDAALQAMAKMGKVDLLAEALTVDADTNPQLVAARYHYVPPPTRTAADQVADLAKRGRKYLESAEGQAAVIKIGKEIFNHFSPIKL